jgi:nitroreductase
MYDIIKTLIESRVSTNFYDANRALPDDTIEELVRLATLAPSAYNFQNWKFIAVRSSEAKEQLKAVAYGQQKIIEAPVTFIVCGTLRAHERLALALQPSVDAGIMERATVDGWVAMANGAHADNPELQRDEALRSASLATMTLMLAAQGMGLATCPMSGFDPAGAAREFKLAANEVPVMLVTVGYAATENWPQKLRKPVADVLVYA